MSKKILIMLYQEGASGFEAMGRVGSNYGLRRMVADANAAAEAIVAEGGKAFVCDVCQKGRDIFATELTDKAERVAVSALPQLLQEGIDGAALVGVHARNGAANAFYSYTHNEIAWHEYRVNGKVYGDIGMAAIFLGSYGVPVVAITGDKAAVEEAQELLGTLPFAIVKQSVIRNAAKCLPQEEARALIQGAVAKGMNESGSFKPYVVSAPYRIEVTFNRVDFCDDCMMYNFGACDRISPLVAGKTVEKIVNLSDLRF